MRIVEASRIHEEISRKQKQSGLDIKGFGEKIGVNRQAMSRLVNGKALPSDKTCKAMGIEIVFRVSA